MTSLTSRLSIIAITLTIMSMAIYAFALNTALPWHPLQQIVRDPTSLTPTSLDENNNGRIDPGIIEDTLQDITNNGASTTNPITVGGLTSNGGIVVSGNAVFNGNVRLPSIICGAGKRLHTDANGNIVCGNNDDDPSNELQTLAEVLQQGNDAQGNRIIGLSMVRGVGSLNGALRIDTGNGYVDIGPKNTVWSHFYTDRPRYYFNKGITVDTGLIGSYNENLYLQTSGTTRLTILNSNGNVGIGTTNPQAKLDIRNSGEIIQIGRDVSNPSIELRDTDSDGKVPYIDFINDATTDYDMRIILNGDNELKVTGGNLRAEGLCLSDGCKTSWSQVGGKPTISFYTASCSGNCITTIYNVDVCFLSGYYFWDSESSHSWEKCEVWKEGNVWKLQYYTGDPTGVGHCNAICLKW